MNIIFDLSGTLIDTEMVSICAINQALKDMGRDEVEDGAILAAIGESIEKLAQNLLKTTKLQTINRFGELIKQYELQIIPDKAKLYPGALELLLYLKRFGHTASICTNEDKEYIFALLDNFCIGMLFDAIWYKRAGFLKEQAVNEILRALNNNKKAVFVGGRLSDIGAAKQSRLPCVSILHGLGRKEESKSADYIVSNLKELKDFIVTYDNNPVKRNKGSRYDPLLKPAGPHNRLQV